MKRITQSVLALLLMLTGSTNVMALETYDFQDLSLAIRTATNSGGPWAVNDGGDAGFTINDATMHYLGDYTDYGFTWNNRFAYEFVDGRNKFTFRSKTSSKDKNCGMFSWDYAHYFSILNLKNGDKVTITIATGTVTFVSENVEGEIAAGSNVASNTTYTISTTEETTRLDIQMAKASLIAKIVIEPYGVETIPVIAVSPKTLNLIPGASAKLKASVDPAGMATQWTSSDETVATVADDGTVTAVAAGTVTITNSWRSEISDAMAADACEVTVADIDLSEYTVTKAYDFTAMGDVALTLQEEAAGAIWNEANNQKNDVFFCTNEGLENIAVQAALSSNKGWSIISGKGLTLGSGAGRCAAIGGIKKDQIVEFIYTGDAFYTRSTDDGIDKTALNEETGRAIYQANEDGMIGFELVKGNAVKQINIYTEEAQPVEDEVITATVAEFNAAEVSETVWYQLTGVVKNLQAGDQYGNFDIEDETGSVFVYGVLSEKGGAKKQFQDLVAQYGIANGSKLTIIGNRGVFNEKIEVLNAYFVSVDNSGVEPVVFEGDGTQENPYTVADVKAMTQKPADHVWVKGYIVGALASKSSFDNTKDTNIALAAEANVEEASATIPVQLPQGPMREGLNIVDNPENIGKLVKVCGVITDYFSTIGVKSIDQFEMDGVVVGIVELNADAQQQGTIYNLAGQRVVKAQKGLYIINGKKVVVK